MLEEPRSGYLGGFIYTYYARTELAAAASTMQGAAAEFMQIDRQDGQPGTPAQSGGGQGGQPGTPAQSGGGQGAVPSASAGGSAGGGPGPSPNPNSLATGDVIEVYWPEGGGGWFEAAVREYVLCC